MAGMVGHAQHEIDHGQGGLLHLGQSPGLGGGGGGPHAVACPFQRVAEGASGG
jgi:hypothetical protein